MKAKGWKPWQYILAGAAGTLLLGLAGVSAGLLASPELRKLAGFSNHPADSISSASTAAPTKTAKASPTSTTSQSDFSSPVIPDLDWLQTPTPFVFNFPVIEAPTPDIPEIVVPDIPSYVDPRVTNPDWPYAPGSAPWRQPYIPPVGPNNPVYVPPFNPNPVFVSPPSISGIGPNGIPNIP